MARKTFIADFEISRKQNIPGISSVARGENDEDINVSFVPHGGVPIEIVLLAQPGTSMCWLIYVPIALIGMAWLRLEIQVSNFLHFYRLDLATTLGPWLCVH
jgi:hypothetical protein